MADDPHDVRDIPIGTPMRAFDGSVLGSVREVHPHYLLVGQEGEHSHRDLEVPVHAIRGLACDLTSCGAADNRDVRIMRCRRHGLVPLSASTKCCSMKVAASRSAFSSLARLVKPWPSSG
jgi:hypothetical protein